MIVRSTRHCTNTPRLLFVLEEAGVSYVSEIAEDGYFTRTYGIPGPALEDDGYVLVELGALLRHAARRYAFGTLWPAEVDAMGQVDRWLDFMSRRISRAMDKPDALRGFLEVLDRQLGDQPFVLGALTVADCGFSALVPKRAKLPTDGLPRVTAYLDRLAARPAYRRAVERTPTA